MGDLNTKVVKEGDGELTGKYELATRNERGKMGPIVQD